MKPAVVGGVESLRTVLAIDKLGAKLVLEIESLVGSRHPQYAYLFADKPFAPVELDRCICGCGAFDLYFGKHPLSLLADTRLPAVPEEMLFDVLAMARLAYWVSLLDIGNNVRVREGNIEFRGNFIARLYRVVTGFINNDLRLVHQGVQGV